MASIFLVHEREWREQEPGCGLTVEKAEASGLIQE
jgi:hypothetical protein